MAAVRVSQALRKDPLNVPALMASAKLAEQKKDSAAARQSYEKVLSRYPDFAPAKRELTLLRARTPGAVGADAVELAVQAREGFPDDRELQKALGILLARSENPSRALSVLKEVRRYSPSDSEVLYYLGASQIKLKEAAAGKESLEKALALGLPAELAASAKQLLNRAPQEPARTR